MILFEAIYLLPNEETHLIYIRIYFNPYRFKENFKYEIRNNEI